MRLILASKSKTRKQILDSLNIKYEIIPSNEEEKSNSSNPLDYAIDISKQKAYCVRKKVDSGIILACDSIAYMDNQVFGKPKSKDEAKAFLKKLSGKQNFAITGVTILDLYKDKELNFACKTIVKFRDMTDSEINWYIENEPYILERAGYSIAGLSKLFVEYIDGEYENVLGLPISLIFSKLKELGYEILDFV